MIYKVICKQAYSYDSYPVEHRYLNIDTYVDL